jgi:UDPglucose 6-dehydrogenase
VRVYDPEVKSLPPELGAAVEYSESACDALAGADAAVIATEWPVFREMRAEDFTRTMNRPLLLDPNRFLEKSLGDLTRMQYVAVGTPKGSTCS